MSAVFIGIGQFVLLYFILRYSKEAMWVPIFNIGLTAVYSLLIKPYVVWKDIDYSIKELGMCYWCCLKVLVLSLVAGAYTHLCAFDGRSRSLRHYEGC